MRKLVVDYPLILLILATTVFASVAIIVVSLTISGIEPLKEQALVTGVVSSLLPTIAAILVLFRVQASDKKIDAKIEVVKESTQKTGQIVDALATNVGESLEGADLKTIEQMGPYMHDSFHTVNNNLHTVITKLATLIEIMERKQWPKQ